MLPLVSEFGFNGDAEFVGPSPRDGAVITYYLKKRHMIGDLKLEVYDAQGALLTTIPGGKRRGINRVEWTDAVARAARRRRARESSRACAPWSARARSRAPTP